MDSTRKLWTGLAILLIASFAVLLWAGQEIFRAAPPVPERVVDESGEVIYTRADIERGRQVWQSIGGMQLGSIWGHGGYVAPDWSADWLHRELIALLDQWAIATGVDSFADAPAELKGLLQARLQPAVRRNTYDADTGTITVSAERAAAMREVSQHYESLFGSKPETAELREAYAMRNNTVADREQRRALASFFWWTAWAAATERPGQMNDTLAPAGRGELPEQRVTYTNNWPSEPLIGNRPAPSLWLWSAFSVVFLLAGIGLLG